MITLPATASSLQTNLQGYWQFDGNGTDTSGNGRTLDLLGGIGFGSGLLGQALSFPNDESKLAIRPINDPIFNFGTNDFTIQTWVNFNSTANEQTLIEKYVGPSSPGWTLTKMSNNVLRFSDVAGLGLQGDSSALNISLGTFHQFIMRRSGSLFNMFLDNSLVGSFTSTNAISNTTKPLLIGGRDGSQNLPVNGLIDEVAIWNRALSDTEVAEIYNNGAGKSLIESASIPEPSSNLGLLSFSILGLGTTLKRKSLTNLK